MWKALLLKEKRSWLRLLLPGAMADMADMVEAHLLKSPEVAAAAPVLAAMAASRLQSPASDEPPDECAGETPAALKRRDNNKLTAIRAKNRL